MAYGTDLAHIKGQEQVKRGLEVAASGGHNVLMQGPPGAGKTLLARALPSILPPLTIGEALDVRIVANGRDWALEGSVNPTAEGVLTRTC